MRPPTPDEIATAATLTGDPIALNDRATRGHRPPRPGKKPRGRPRKDGQPPHQSPTAAAQEHHAAACKVYALGKTSPNTIGTATNYAQRITSERDPDDVTAPPAKYADISLEKKIENLDNNQISSRARTFLQVYARMGHRDAMRAAGVSAAGLWGMRNNPIFAEIYAELRKAHDAATIEKTTQTLTELANGEYKPRPDCLPPDMRAASLLMPALDERFRASGPTAAQQVQININI